MKRAFTITEFIICTTIMVTIMGAIVAIPFKMAKQTKPVLGDGKSEICDSARAGSKGYCDIKLENLMYKHEFFTIELVGGGAVGTSTCAGGHGERKTVYYPTLEDGDYRAYIGKAGNATKKNGGTSALYKKNSNEIWELLEFALGGIQAADSENCPTSISSPGSGAKSNELSKALAGVVAIKW